MVLQRINVKGVLHDWVNEGSISFIWHICLHYQACISKSNGKFYNKISHPTLYQVPSDIFLWNFKNNSICPVCTKTWSENSIICDVCDGCDHCKCIGKEFYKNHSKTRYLMKSAFICNYYMEQIKINLEVYHSSLQKKEPLRLTESVNCFFHS